MKPKRTKPDPVADTLGRIAQDSVKNKPARITSVEIKGEFATVQYEGDPGRIDPADPTVQNRLVAVVFPVVASSPERSLLADNLRRLRKQAGWSQAQLAEAVGIDPRNVQRHEEGLGYVPGVIAEYAQAFSLRLNRTVTVEDLIG